MSQYIRTFLGYNSTKSATSTTTTVQGLPSSWYRSDALYQLERRAIFSKRWILVSHKNRFSASGHFVQFEEAGFRFFLCQDRDGNINGFHNVCRHRAFPVVTEPHGKAQIISCRYHGWSYSLKGDLAKAPGYDEMDGFDRGKNGLLSINVHIDAKGFIWVNLDAKNEVPWEADFDGVDMQARMDGFNFNDYRFDHTWEMSGNYNWKALADNYNECYHCPTTHPDVAGLVDVKIYGVETKGGHIQHYASQEQTIEDNALGIRSTFYFPNACMTVTPHFFYMMRCVPTSAHHCSMEYEVYRHKEATDSAFEKIDSIFKRILSEDKWLCNNVQRNLEAGVFVSGEMHTRMEKGPLFFQDTVRKLVKAHHECETRLKREIWPARQHLPADALDAAQDEDFCAALKCSNDVSGKLDW